MGKERPTIKELVKRFKKYQDNKKAEVESTLNKKMVDEKLKKRYQP